LILAVCDTDEAMRAFMDAGGFTFPVMLDVGEVYQAYGVSAIPMIVIIDAEGQIVDTMVGAASADELSDAVADLSD
jgi:peroxiredoxin